MLQFSLDGHAKRELFSQLLPGVRLPDGGDLQIEGRVEQLNELLLAARVHCLSKDELYFLQHCEELRRPLNHRNEAAAVSLLLQRLPAEAADAPAAGGLVALRRAISQHCQSLWPEFSSGDAALCGQQPPPAAPPPAGTPASDFLAWAAGRGVQAAIEVASFGGLRGCAATRAVEAGESVLSVPRDVLIYDDTVKETDLGRMLAALPGLPTDHLLILFTMIDRWDADSAWAPFWLSLPAAFFTGLSFPPALVAALDGTAAALEIRRGQEHLREAYESTRPLMDVLLQAYPQHLEARWFCYEAYLWAAELWYSYAFEIEFPPAPKSKTVMVPFACLVNHSPWPHVVRYGRLDPATRTLDYPAFRPCAAGAQAFISYGPVPNLKLLAYYGFVIPNNPHDLVPMQLEPPAGGLRPLQQAVLDEHNLGLEHSLRDGPLAGALLACLRVVAATDEELRDSAAGGASPLAGPLSPECEVQALSMLREAVQAMLKPVLARLAELAAPQAGGGSAANDDAVRLSPGEQRDVERRKAAGGGGVCNENGFDTGWRASLRFCELYLFGQRRILERSLREGRSLEQRA